MEIGTIRKFSATGLVASLLPGVTPVWAHGWQYDYGHWPRHHHGHRPEIVAIPPPIAYVPRPTYHYVLPLGLPMIAARHRWHIRMQQEFMNIAGNRRIAKGSNHGTIRG